VDRGYVDITGKLASLGANIKRIDVAEPFVTVSVQPEMYEPVIAAKMEAAVNAAAEAQAVIAVMSSEAAAEKLNETEFDYKREKEVSRIKAQPTWA
jgi:UDP-N-acetylglucosamine 1-carboxyvinyltransferase